MPAGLPASPSWTPEQFERSSPSIHPSDPSNVGVLKRRRRSGRLSTRRGRLWLALGAGVVVLLCLGAVGVIVALYDSATEVKRSEPDVVVDSFLRAYLVNRDDNEAALYECKPGSTLAQIASYRSQVLSDEKKFSLGIRVTWTSLQVSDQSGSTTVTTQIHRAFADGSERATDNWIFGMQNQDGWRVCDARRTS